MNKIFFLFLLLPLISFADDENLSKCIEQAKDSSAAIYACLDKFEIENPDDCIEYFRDSDGYSEEKTIKMCTDLIYVLDLVVYLENRPTEFYDLYGKAVEDISTVKTYGCSVPETEGGLDAFNAAVFQYDGVPMVGGSKIISEEWFILKAIVHINEDNNYAEINYGHTIYPISDYRFFTNTLKVDGDRYIGAVDINIDGKFTGGSDKGDFKGRGWIIDTKNNTLSIFVNNIEIGFISDCRWGDVALKELEANGKK
tara:strand:- start:87 stop:851 length:765 start_codon:yes stop_codon:yes gene_type:complete